VHCSTCPLTLSSTDDTLAHILLVDDETSVLNVISRILAVGGHSVTVASTRTEAIARLQDGPRVDLFILDFWIGTDNGLHLMEALLQLQPATPVLFLSGGNGTVPLEATTALAEMQGAAEFLYKPIEAPALLAAVKRHI